ncbi:MAG: hypothetical protein IJS57_06155 [Paludibacteraceae bacterium]|nr:hypothetical protein [Paludibacteraceae bacterium]
MSRRDENRAMYRRWIYMVVAILASVFMLFHPACRFLEDKGIRYIRSFSMTQTEITVTQTDLKTNADTVTATMSVKGLYYCVIAMIVGSSLCFLCFFDDKWRIILAIITACIAGLYYVLFVYYIFQIADKQFATVYPNFVVILPAIICQMMLLTRRSIFQEIADTEEEGSEE